MNKLSLIKSIKNHTEVEEEESSFLLILVECPVGGSSVGVRLSTFLKNESKWEGPTRHAHAGATLAVCIPPRSL
jgi:hypothetical protein